MNVVVVAPHPDDEIIGVGGTIAKHSDNGDDVYVIVATKGDKYVYPDETIRKGREQEKIADEVLGVREILYMDFPSPLLDTYPHAEIVMMLQGFISELNPQVIYIPHYGDMHIEHRIISECCMVALRPKVFSNIEIYGYEVMSETGWNIPAQHNEFIPNVYVKIDEEFDRKKEALKIFDSQMNEYPSARSVEAIECLAKLRGAMVGTKMAEAFSLIRMQRS